jgi:uncharacterized protein
MYVVDRDISVVYNILRNYEILLIEHFRLVTLGSLTPTQAFIVQNLHSHLGPISDLGVKSLAIFGSVARNEAKADSDIDILVEFSRPVGLFEFLEVKEYLENLLDLPVDLVTPDAIRPEMKEKILGEAIYI